MPAEKCPWCGHPPCSDTQKSAEHHRLCCLDGPRRPCWGAPSGQPILDATPDLEGEAA